MFREVAVGYLASITISLLLLWREYRVAIWYKPGGDRE